MILTNLIPAVIASIIGIAIAVVIVKVINMPSAEDVQREKAGHISMVRRLTEVHVYELLAKGEYAEYVVENPDERIKTAKRFGFGSGCLTADEAYFPIKAFCVFARFEGDGQTEDRVTAPRYVDVTVYNDFKEVVFEHRFFLGEEHNWTWEIIDEELLLGNYRYEHKRQEKEKERVSFENQYRHRNRVLHQTDLDERLLTAYKKYINGNNKEGVIFAKECIKQGFLKDGSIVAKTVPETFLSAAELCDRELILGECCERTGENDDALIHYGNAIDVGSIKAIADYVRVCITSNIENDASQRQTIEKLERRLLKDRTENLSAVASLALAYAGFHGGNVSKNKSGALFNMVMRESNKSSCEYIKSEIGLKFLEGGSVAIPQDLKKKAKKIMESMTEEDIELAMLIQ